MINWDRASLSTVLLDWEGKVTNSVLKTNDPSKFRFCVFKERDCYYIMLNLLLVYFRAPVLVAIALIEAGMKYEDAVSFIRRYSKVQIFVILPNEDGPSV